MTMRLEHHHVFIAQMEAESVSCSSLLQVDLYPGVILLLLYSFSIILRFYLLPFLRVAVEHFV